MSISQIGCTKRFQILQRDDFTCAYCDARPGNDRLQIDHMISRAYGGSDHENNLITSCDRCNNGKSKQIIIPRKICVGVFDKSGWIIWRGWGDWKLSFCPDDSSFSEHPAVLSLGEHLCEYWIPLNRVHEDDWEIHMKEKVWMEEGSLFPDFCKALDFCRTLVNPEPGQIGMAAKRVSY